MVTNSYDDGHQLAWDARKFNKFNLLQKAFYHKKIDMKIEKYEGFFM